MGILLEQRPQHQDVISLGPSYTTKQRTGLVATALKKCEKVDFAGISLRMRLKGHRQSEIERRIDLYKKFLSLNLAFKDCAIVPTEEIDEVWHLHILDTRAYAKDCDIIFGSFFHHFPYFGLRSENDAVALKKSFEKTNELWEMHFGHPMTARLKGEASCTGKSCSSCKTR